MRASLEAHVARGYSVVALVLQSSVSEFCYSFTSYRLKAALSMALNFRALLLAAILLCSRNTEASPYRLARGYSGSLIDTEPCETSSTTTSIIDTEPCDESTTSLSTSSSISEPCDTTTTTFTQLQTTTYVIISTLLTVVSSNSSVVPPLTNSTFSSGLQSSSQIGNL